MGIIGGSFAYWYLRTYYPLGENRPFSNADPYEVRGESKLTALFGEEIYSELTGKLVLDFGCGDGTQAIELARRCAAEVVGLDMREQCLVRARAEAKRQGVADRCTFVQSCDCRADVVITLDAFEHFDDPAGVLLEMRRLVKDSGYVLVEFGYPWYHPYGGHLFSVFPWAHVVFTEKSLVRWRSDFKTDGAKRFREVEGGLNQMSISRWERLVASSPFRFQTYELVPIGPLRSFHNRLTREFLTSIVRARLVPR